MNLQFFGGRGSSSGKGGGGIEKFIIPINSNTKYPVYKTIPKGWVVDYGGLTAPKGYRWINNNKSRFDKERKSGFISVDYLLKLRGIN